jgi:hypothetical protein
MMPVRDRDRDRRQATSEEAERRRKAGWITSSLGEVEMRGMRLIGVVRSALSRCGGCDYGVYQHQLENTIMNINT